MATILNRSRHTVTVKRRDDLTRTFPYNKLPDVQAYRAQLRSEGLNAQLSQGEDHLHVRIRQRDYPPVSFSATSYAEAELAINRIESERAVGLFIDYGKAHRIKFAQLVLDYLDNPAVKKLEGYANYKTTLTGMVADSTGELIRALERRDELVAADEIPPKIKARRIPQRCLEWMQRPFAAVTPADIQSYINERLDDGIAEGTDTSNCFR